MMILASAVLAGSFLPRVRKPAVAAAEAEEDTAVADLVAATWAALVAITWAVALTAVTWPAWAATTFAAVAAAFTTTALVARITSSDTWPYSCNY